MMKPTLYLMFGYPGAGKTTVANVLHDLTGATHLWADQTRLELFGEPDMDQYTHEQNTQLYDYLNDTTLDLLRRGQSVIYDTNFRYRKDRDYMRSLTASLDITVVTIWVQTPLELAHDRATTDAHLQASRVHGNMSDDTFKRLSDHLDEPGEDEHVVCINGTKVTPDYLRAKLTL
jgi:predicted kinase